jgi:beta-N-acetylhexosaminidase
MTALTLEQICGQLIVCGFSGTEVPPPLLARLERGQCGGTIVFRRNLPDLDTALSLNEAVIRAAPPELPPFLGIDEEGGRVCRLPRPAMSLPPMRQLGAAGVVDLARQAGAALGRQLAALGYNLDFAPVLDVDSNPNNPIIGDRSFGRDPAAVTRLGLAFAAGLDAGGVLACGKHFPGHGDTEKDSHLDLPAILRDEASVRATELPPFRAAASAKIAALMSAHVVFEALDAGVPATLSSRICTQLLRGELEFEGVLFSDDLEMRALADRIPIEDTAVRAIAAGCDTLLICHSLAWQERAHAALVAEAHRDPAFSDRCHEALQRNLSARLRRPPEPASVALALEVGQEIARIRQLVG